MPSARNWLHSLPIGDRKTEEAMQMLWKYVPRAQIWRVQHDAYLRWCKTGVGEPALDARLTRKLTKQRKLSWRVERRHMRRLLRVEALGTML